MKRTLLTILILMLPYTARADKLQQAIDSLHAPSFKIRTMMALVLGKQTKHAHRVVVPLIAALKDRHRAVRGAAASSLGLLGAIEALSALSAARSDEDQTVSRIAGRAIKKVIKLFVKKRGKFKDNLYNFTIAGLQSHQVETSHLVGPLKDLIMERLLKFKNVDVGGSAAFDPGSAGQQKSRILLDLSGRILSANNKRCELSLTLALRPGGYVVSQWKRVSATGKSEQDALKNAAATGIAKILKFLGAR
jgi:hypothetical protein